MESNIHVSPEALAAFSEEVAAFSGRIEEHCATLRTAMRAFSKSMDEETGETIEKDLEKICRCLEDSQEPLAVLRDRVEHYQVLVERLRALARGQAGGEAAFGDLGVSHRAGAGGTGDALTRAATAVPRALSQSRYGFVPMLMGGSWCRMYNNPTETAQTLIGKQGNNARNARGDCGVCQCVNLLRMAGIDVSEDDAIAVALSCSPDVVEGLTIYDPDPNNRGGTGAWGRQEIMGKYNLRTDIYPIPYDRTQASAYLAKKISEGHGVIVSVDAGRFWKNPAYLGGGHAISLISVSETGDRFFYNDTGSGRSGVVSAAHLMASLTGRPANITRYIIR